jgi:RNA polymerase primary sigma factor
MLHPFSTPISPNTRDNQTLSQALSIISIIGTVAALTINHQLQTDLRKVTKGVVMKKAHKPQEIDVIENQDELLLDEPANDDLEAEDEEESKEEDTTEYSDDALKVYLRDVHKGRLLDAAEERELATRVAKGDKLARQKMIEANLRLVVNVAKRYVNRGMSFLDLIEEGNMGLIKAVDRFRVDKECRFSTYGMWWIRQSIERALVNQSRVVRLPVHISENIAKIQRVTRELGKNNDSEPTAKDIADKMEVPVTQVRQLMSLHKRSLSLELCMGEFHDYTLAETLEDPNATSPHDLLQSLSDYEVVLNGIKGLSRYEKSVLFMRFGLNDREPQTLETIGNRFGVTRERIRQIESRALNKLRQCFAPNHQGMASNEN